MWLKINLFDSWNREFHDYSKNVLKINFKVIFSVNVLLYMIDFSRVNHKENILSTILITHYKILQNLLIKREIS